MSHGREGTTAKAEVVCGVNAVMALLEARSRPVRRLWLASERGRDRRLAELEKLAGAQRIPIDRAARTELDRLVGGSGHQGVVAEAGPLPSLDLEELLRSAAQTPLLVVVDWVEDPRNLGAILRTAGAAGATGVVLPRRRQAPLGSTALRVAEGAAEYVPVVAVANLRRALGQLKRAGIWIVGLEASAETSWDAVDMTGPTALVVGSESRGLKRIIRESCDFLVSLPVRPELGSLNVSVAAGVALYEALRQRRRART